MKLDKFKDEYLDKLLGSDKEVSWKPTEKACVYYFNVDIKFILKARLYELGNNHGSNVDQYNNQDKYKCNNQCTKGANREYSEVEAVGE